MCTLCLANDIDDEYHYMFICEYFKDVRERFVSKCYYKKPCYKICELLKRKGKKSLIKLAQFANVICNNFNVDKKFCSIHIMCLLVLEL